MAEHQWVGPNKVVRWVHCDVCGVIKRLDGNNSVECKGRAPIVPRDVSTVTEVRND